VPEHVQPAHRVVRTNQVRLAGDDLAVERDEVVAVLRLECVLVDARHQQVALEVQLDRQVKHDAWSEQRDEEFTPNVLFLV